MICYPNAKLNLGLHVVNKREDGYHNLETVFYPLHICDALEVIVAPKSRKDTLRTYGLQIDAPEKDNLVMRAVKLMRKHFKFPAVEVHLYKKIPSGAGLGGGSSDATFMLKLLNEKFQLGASPEFLASLAVQLGADCPFFIYNRPLLATGIGELFEEVQIDLSQYYFVVITPNIHVSTKDAFGGIQPCHPEHSLHEIMSMPICEWRNVLKNDFEKTVFEKHPQLADIKEELYNAGASYAAMSGSGSAVFGIFHRYISPGAFKHQHYIIVDKKTVTA